MEVDADFSILLPDGLLLWCVGVVNAGAPYGMNLYIFFSCVVFGAYTPFGIYLRIVVSWFSRLYDK